MKQKKYKVELYAFYGSLLTAEKILENIIPVDGSVENMKWDIAEGITEAASAGRWYRVGGTTFNPLNFSAIEVHVSEA